MNKIYNVRFISLFSMLALLSLSSIAVSSNAQSDVPITELQFVNHIQLDAAEQDVMWMDEDGALWRVAPEIPLSTLNMPMYASATGAEHDPFQLSENPLGPYEPDVELGFTLSEWLAASGEGIYMVDEASATLDISFSNLVPNGVYTMWCSRIHLPDDFKIDNYPCGAADGSENSFVADSDGNANYSITMTPVLPTTDTMLSVFAVNYHSDGNTYGADPGNFGHNAHVQILALAPSASQ